MAATSSGVPKRPIGILDNMKAMCSALIWSKMAVRRAQRSSVVGGSVGRRLQPRPPPSVLARCVQPQGDAMDGALQRLRGALGLALGPASRVEGLA